MTVIIPSSYELTRPPRNDDELYQVVKAFWNVTIPRGKHCPHHQAPFDAFATAFFAREPQVLCLGSRGLSGKSQMMSVLGLTEAVVLGSDANIVGGSEQQSKNVLEHMGRAWEAPGSPRNMLVKQNTDEWVLANQARIRPLTASQKSVRGPHPARLLLDEIDEMDPEILESAKGQPMPQPNWLGVRIPQQTIMVSTLQYADGTMMKEMARFKDEDLPIFEWCVASGSMITTARGQVPIEEVTDRDHVLTRHGFRHVQHVTFMGVKSTVRLDVGDQSLHVTGDHLIATPDGWREASALAADAMATPRPDVRVLGSELVPLTAVTGTVLVPPRSGLILGVGDRVQVLDVHTGAITTQVIDSEAFLDGAYYALPDPAMGLHYGILHTLSAVPVTPKPRPLDAFSGEHGHILPVWDIGVEGDDHEFIANGILVHNCYKDTMLAKDGWLDEDFVEQKKREVSKERWRVEYDLGEPSIGNRAIDSTAVENMFCLVAPEPVKKNRDFEQVEYEAPRTDNHDYVVAADWAQAIDWTVITVWDVTTQPIKCVYYVRMHRRPYPEMVGWFNKLQKRYNAQGIHDATGLGRVVSDMMDARVRNFVMAGRERDDMLSEFVSGVERGQIQAPRIGSFYREILFASVDDLYSRGKDFHLPDAFCSAALAWKLVSHRFPPVDPWASPKSDTNWMADQLANNRDVQHTSTAWRQGEVHSTKDEELFNFT